MRKQLLFGMALSMLMGVSATVYAQEPVVMLHHNGEQTPFGGIDALKNAYEVAVDNDTIYLSGNVFNQPSSYEKSLHIYGTGFLPDSTKATSISILNGQTLLQNGADNFHMEGVLIKSSIKVGNKNDTIAHVRIIACKYDGISAGSNCQATDVQCIQCISTDGFNLTGYVGFVLKNSIVTSGGRILNSNYNLFENNVLISSAWSGSSYRYMIEGNSNLIRNNAIIGAGDGGLNGTSNSLFNNINCTGGTDNAYNESPYTVAVENLFVNYTSSTFSFEQDYHLQNPELYLGTDGTQVGIYGGEYAWPETAKAVLPSNPHIRAFDAASNTDESGMLQINVKVGAQN